MQPSGREQQLNDVKSIVTQLLSKTALLSYQIYLKPLVEITFTLLLSSTESTCPNVKKKTTLNTNTLFISPDGVISKKLRAELMKNPVDTIDDFCSYFLFNSFWAFRFCFKLPNLFVL